MRVLNDQHRNGIAFGALIEPGIHNPQHLTCSRSGGLALDSS